MESASVAASLELTNTICALSYERLDVQTIIASVTNDGAGATAVFIGTTRDSFQGKSVTRLEYQAYSKLALKTMGSIVQTSIPQDSAAIRCAVHHRLGVVPVGEPSIVIAVSSPHRQEAFVACERILEDIKAKVPIWKREYYENENDETAEWKANQ
ncbi:Molybdopterin biosynthesis MoaE [Mycena belliarum]|uniref:Molybdopterin biosynthesis MoaE n=1 Tax=Mycena belliarum TaxID=1033014 RepID=A0AAD6XZN5_9AGAR|nr:Molybdopterin biosynthesis MoaE [Mycena belliae]